jgi:hypothetical protein
MTDTEDYRDFLEYMCGVFVPLHDLTVARKLVADRLVRSVRGLSELPEPPERNIGSMRAYLNACAELLGDDVVHLNPLRPGEFKPRSLTQALAELMG